MAEENTDQNQNAPLDLSAFGSFDFTPDWAKEKSSVKKFDHFKSEGDQSDGASFSRKGGERRRDEKSRDRNDSRSRDGSRRSDSRDRKNGGERRNGEFRKPREFIKPLDAQIRILPSQKDLGTIIRKIQTTHYAYPLKQLAYLILDNPSACVLRVSPKKDTEVVTFHQCKACGYVVTSQEELLAHIISTHMRDYYQIDIVECDPPKGQFPCVARCGLSGELLGPPNYHGYEGRIREMINTRFPQMSESAYRARIEMVRDQEEVEKWRASATTKTIYRRKGDENAPALDRESAEIEFRRNIAPGLLFSGTTIDVTAEMAMKSPFKPLMFACRDMLSQERRFPGAIMYALRGAFHNRKLVFFRANDSRGPEFVTSAKPQNLDLAHAMADLVAIVKFVESHPDASQQSLIAEFAGDDQVKKMELTTKLAWLTEKGYLIAYVNGQVALPAEHPVYRPPRQAKKAEKNVVEEASQKPEEAKKEDAPVAEESVAEATPVVEAPVVEEALAAEEVPAAEENKEKAEEKKDETADQLAE
jgi:hypothetical protein